jgi:Na+/H+ antiporter NhaD/arsenite permease-like protein
MHLLATVLFILALATVYSPALLEASPAQAAHEAAGAGVQDGVKLDIHGKVVNPHGVGVHDAEIEVLIGGKPYKEAVAAHAAHGDSGVRTEPDGTFQVVLDVKAEDLDKGIELKVFKASYAETSIKIDPSQMVKAADGWMVRADITIDRHLGPAFWIATVIFLLAYILISFELLHRTLAAMLGAATMLVISYTIGTFHPEFRILTYESAIHAMDMNVIFLLMGMMIIVGILKHTGIFQWCAYKCYQLAKGKIVLLSIILMTFTAVASAFLDNVTTMLLLTPVTIEIATSLGISPIALLIPEILASNVGGTTTLIGDPPNIMIGSYAGLTFMDFVVNMTPVCIVSMLVLFFYTKLAYGSEFKKARVTDIDAFIEKLRQEYQITDSTLLTVGGIIMATVIGMFLCHGMLHMEVSIAALFGAALLFTYGLITKKIDLLEIVEKDIEWTTLLFFMFLFILVGAVEEVGLLDIVADWVLHLSHESLVPAICLILWVAAILSAFVDNIPFTATMLPIVAYLTSVIPGAESGVLWWALAFGACFGGNGTMIGASANVVTLGIAESAGHPIKFLGFMKVAFPYMIISVALANVWLLVMY